MPNPAPATDFALFGVSGDLSRRKILPALYHLEAEGFLSPQTRLIGLARRDMDREGFLAWTREQLTRFVGRHLAPDVLDRHLGRWHYLRLDFADSAQYQRLAQFVAPERRRFAAYLAVGSPLYAPICEHLAQAGLAEGRARLVLEKPIGTDLSSSRRINETVARHFQEEQVYRIDHYLGKETVLNLVALRFANSIFTTNWDHNTIDHVQITVAEEVGIEGRWGYFDQAGQLRDMVQNHLLQILTLVAMEPPARLDSECIRLEKIKVLKALRPITPENISSYTVRGQYGPGFLRGREICGYRQEEGGDPESDTETFVALRVDIDNWRWAEVPFYLRTGKRLAAKRSEVVIYFKKLPHNLFCASYRRLPPNKLVLRLQPDEGIQVEILNKVPGMDPGIRLQRTRLDLSFSEAFHGRRIGDAYERLLLKVLQGDQALFLHREEVELAWRWIDSIQEGWRQLGEPPKPYPAGSWGPVASVALLARDGREWEE